jgi:hypothetical protein
MYITMNIKDAFGMQVTRYLTQGPESCSWPAEDRKAGRGNSARRISGHRV